MLSRRFYNGLKGAVIAFSALGTGLSIAPAAYADSDDWQFGIGTGLNSLALDGDIGFAGENGGIIADVDLDNGDTADMFESAFGFRFFAMKNLWSFSVGYATLTLEDSDSGLDAEWDRKQAHLEAGYHLAQTGNHRWGILAGIQYVEHDWDIKNKITGFKSKPDDDWTDAVFGVTHHVPIVQKWSWSNRLTYGFGDSEGTYSAKTAINWQPLEHWIFNGSLSYQSIEYGDKGDINKRDFYYYDADETTIGLGFMYTW